MWELIAAKLIVEITSADVIALVNTLNREKIRMDSVCYSNDLTITVEILGIDWKKLQSIAKKQGASVKILGKKGIFWEVAAFIKRPVLMIFVISIFLLSAYLSGRIFFVRIDGNTTIPSNLILETAAQCGIRFGTGRRQVRSEQVKNALLESIPQLQWAGVNTQGCTAIISVREKTVTEQKADRNNEICSIVAVRDGIIQNCTVYEGNPLCTVGQAVKAGQTLVSGYLDCGTVIKTTKADAEISALTSYKLTLVTPKAAVIRGGVIREKKEYAILFGKKLIKITNDSGNLGATCAKIYDEKYLQLPAGFSLPIALVKQTSYYYEEVEDAIASADAQQWLSSFAESYLQRNMIAGKILSAQTEVVQTQEACRLMGNYACEEMIGQIKYEQMIGTGDTNDRANREF